MIALNTAGITFMVVVLLILLVAWAVLSYHEGKEKSMYMSKEYMYKHYPKDSDL